MRYISSVLGNLNPNPVADRRDEMTVPDKRIEMIKAKGYPKL